MTQFRIFALAAAFTIVASALFAQTESGLRGSIPLDAVGPAPPMAPVLNRAEKDTRNYPGQPPLIPHSTEGYQLDLDGNKCLSCHSRARTRESQAPMVSITHFMDRDGQFLATVSPRRYFCTQCHVPQYDVKPPIANDFTDIDTLLSRKQPGVRR